MVPGEEQEVIRAKPTPDCLLIELGGSGPLFLASYKDSLPLL